MGSYNITTLVEKSTVRGFILNGSFGSGSAY